MRVHVFIMLVASGVGLAFLYSGALWWTVHRLPASNRPVLLILASYWLRMGGLAACFYLVMDGGWERLAACLAGFFITRALLIRRAREHSGLPWLAPKG
jgi:F1F0 ATPase subunit 2